MSLVFCKTEGATTVFPALIKVSQILVNFQPSKQCYPKRKWEAQTRGKQADLVSVQALGKKNPETSMKNKIEKTRVFLSAQGLTDFPGEIISDNLKVVAGGALLFLQTIINLVSISSRKKRSINKGK